MHHQARETRAGVQLALDLRLAKDHLARADKPVLGFRDDPLELGLQCGPRLDRIAKLFRRDTDMACVGARRRKSDKRLEIVGVRRTQDVVVIDSTYDAGARY